MLVESFDQSFIHLTTIASVYYIAIEVYVEAIAAVVVPVVARVLPLFES